MTYKDQFYQLVAAWIPNWTGETGEPRDAAPRDVASVRASSTSAVPPGAARSHEASALIDAAR